MAQVGSEPLLPIGRYVFDASRSGGDGAPSPDLSIANPLNSNTKVTPAIEPLPGPSEARSARRETSQSGGRRQAGSRPSERLDSGGEHEGADDGLQDQTYLTEQVARQRGRTQGRRPDPLPQSHRYAAPEPERHRRHSDHMSQSSTQERPKSSGSGQLEGTSG